MADLRSGFLANHHILVKRLDTEDLLPDCISHGLITLEEQELISHEITGPQRTDRFLSVIHRRGQQKPDTFDELLKLLSESSGQLLDDVLEQIRVDSVDPDIQARFASDVDRDKPLSQGKHLEDKIIESLSVNEVLPLLISHGVVSLKDNESIRSRSSEEEKVIELLKIIKLKGKSAYDKFVKVLLQSESQASLGEWLKSQEPIIGQTANSEVLNSERFSRLLNESEESVHKLIADIAMKFYKLGLEEGLQAAMMSRVKTVGDGAAAGPPPPPDTTKSRAIAEQLKAVTDELPKDVQEETRIAFMKLFQKTSVFAISRESIQATCASIMVKHNTHFPSGWHQIAFIYYAMFQVVLAIKEESGDISTETREKQVANFVGPTLADLGLYEWMEKHGGMEKFGSTVEGEDAAVLIQNSSSEPEN